MPSYINEQLVVIATTTLSLLTAWAWNSVVQEYLTVYHSSSLNAKILYAAIITVLTLVFINWLLNTFEIGNEKLKKVINTTDLTSYVNSKSINT